MEQIMENLDEDILAILIFCGIIEAYDAYAKKMSERAALYPWNFRK